ncbi:MAG: bifunctional DNA-formamidopyrimidine glycosylase/DNA-(apurinic or apyrimidinic site) lyase [Nitrospirae bacterium]|nr:bifunctional DNA-formamidopyrimidine glycosylase/DNA-(apurinic or apyrimidinic site) lyase [Nitrospirota bacterium]
MELPEAEVLCRQLRESLGGRRIASVQILTPAFVEGTARALAGGRISSVTRYGKAIALDLARGRAAEVVVLLQLGMTGQLLLREDGSALQPHTHIVLGFEGHNRVLHVRDARRFGRMVVMSPHAFSMWRLDNTAADPLGMSASEFCRRVRVRRAPIKRVLLNQRVVAGIGNIYSDEALFEAGLHPMSPACSFPDEDLGRLHAALARVLSRAIAAGGSTISDFVDLYGRKGGFQRQHRIYGRYGRPCPECGTVLRRIRETSRSFTYCPRCQPAGVCRSARHGRHRIV